MKKQPKGRPKKKFGVKAEHVMVRVTPNTKNFFERAAYAAEMEFSDWVRHILTDAARKQLGESEPVT